MFALPAAIAHATNPLLEGASFPWMSGECHLYVGFPNLQCLFEEHLLPSGTRLRQAGMQQSHPQ
jgi:hypothetical protein